MFHDILRTEKFCPAMRAVKVLKLFLFQSWASFSWRFLIGCLHGHFLNLKSFLVLFIVGINCSNFRENSLSLSRGPFHLFKLLLVFQLLLIFLELSGEPHIRADYVSLLAYKVECFPVSHRVVLHEVCYDHGRWSRNSCETIGIVLKERVIQMGLTSERGLHHEQYLLEWT